MLRKWRRRWFVLTSEYLCSCKRQGDYATVTEFLRLEDCLSVQSVDADTGKQNSFTIVTRARTFVLIADSALDKEAWMNSITDWCLPVMIASMGVQRCLSDFAIFESEKENDYVSCGTSPIRWLKESSSPQSLKSQEPLSSKQLIAPQGVIFPGQIPSPTRGGRGRVVRLLDGTFDEAAAAASFQQAVTKWREENVPSLQVGDRVYARDYDVQSWISGIVTTVEPLWVQPHGKSSSFSFKYVQRSV